MQKVVASRYLIVDSVLYFLLRCYIYFIGNYWLLKVTETQSSDIPVKAAPRFTFNMLAHGPFHNGSLRSTLIKA